MAICRLRRCCLFSINFLSTNIRVLGSSDCCWRLDQGLVRRRYCYGGDNTKVKRRSEQKGKREPNKISLSPLFLFPLSPLIESRWLIAPSSFVILLSWLVLKFFV